MTGCKGNEFVSTLKHRGKHQQCTGYVFESSESYIYRVGSANFSRRKIGHPHDNSADSENVAGAREPSVHAHFIFVSKTVREIRAFFYL